MPVAPTLEIAPKKARKSSTETTRPDRLFDDYLFFGKVLSMWLGKLFGGRKRPPEIDPNEEPARFVAPTSVGIGAPVELKRRAPEPSQSTPPGFDPYNSGSFKKKDDAWVRVGRR